MDNPIASDRTWVERNGGLLWSSISSRIANPPKLIMCDCCGVEDDEIQTIELADNDSIDICADCIDEASALQKIAEPITFTTFTGEWGEDDEYTYPLPFSGPREFVFNPPLIVRFEVVVCEPESRTPGWGLPCLLASHPYAADNDLFYQDRLSYLTGDDPEKIANEIARNVVDYYQWNEAPLQGYLSRYTPDELEERRIENATTLAFVKPIVPLPPYAPHSSPSHKDDGSSTASNE